MERELTKAQELTYELKVGEVMKKEVITVKPSDSMRDLREIFKVARPKSVTVLRMEVPCCGGLSYVAEQARNAVAPGMPLEVKVIGIDGALR